MHVWRVLLLCGVICMHVTQSLAGRVDSYPRSPARHAYDVKKLPKFGMPLSTPGYNRTPRSTRRTTARPHNTRPRNSGLTSRSRLCRGVLHDVGSSGRRFLQAQVRHSTSQAAKETSAMHGHIYQHSMQRGHARRPCMRLNPLRRKLFPATPLPG